VPSSEANAPAGRRLIEASWTGIILDRDRNKTLVWCYEDADDCYWPLAAATAAAAVIAATAATAANRQRLALSRGLIRAEVAANV